MGIKAMGGVRQKRVRFDILAGRELESERGRDWERERLRERQGERE